MKEIEANREAWGKIAEDHYRTFKQKLSEETSLLNRIITEELGDVKGKKLIHLQCNTGADTLSIARMGGEVTGVDLVPDNVRYARHLAEDFGLKARFIESDIMRLMDMHDEKYDIVFTSEGAIGWLPDLNRWAQTIRHLLKDDGFFYAFDSHPFQLTFNEDRMFDDGELELQYPYFGKEPDESGQIGGYASESKEAVNYFWVYTVSDLINSLVGAGLVVEFFNEYDVLYYQMGNMSQVEKGLYRHSKLAGEIPMSFSLKATVRK